MRKMGLFLLRSYYRLLSVCWPSSAGEKAFYLFQKTRKLPFKISERKFYEHAETFEIVHPRENVRAYAMGDPAGKLVVLVHGWESNAGSMGAIAEALAFKGCRVVALDLPAHGKSQLIRTNLRECREALRALIYHLRPSKPFSIVTHSFGSVVASFALADSRYTIDQFVMLTVPNKMITIFEDFKRMIGLGDAAFETLLSLTEAVLGESVRTANVADKLQCIRYNNLVLIHDMNDKVLPYSNSLEIKSAASNVTLHSILNSGHYRMLWNNAVVERVEYVITENESSIEQPTRMASVASV
jgi:pimeloyl-ACP methyl ester carboxylesterase